MTEPRGARQEEDECHPEFWEIQSKIAKGLYWGLQDAAKRNGEPGAVREGCE